MCKLAAADDGVCQFWGTKYNILNIDFMHPTLTQRWNNQVYHKALCHQINIYRLQVLPPFLTNVHDLKQIKRRVFMHKLCICRTLDSDLLWADHLMSTNPTNHLPQLQLLFQWLWWGEMVSIYSQLPHPHLWWQEVAWCCSLHMFSKRGHRRLLVQGPHKQQTPSL